MFFNQPKNEEERREKVESYAESLESKHSDLDHLRPEEIHDDLEADDVVVVDVRSEKERAVSRIPGAVDSEEVEASPENYAGRRLVAYCTVGGRSSEWAEKMADEGLDVANLRGSILAWTHAGYRLQDPAGEPTNRVHVAAKKYAFQADGYEPVY